MTISTLYTKHNSYTSVIVGTQNQNANTQWGKEDRNKSMQGLLLKSVDWAQCLMISKLILVYIDVA